MLDKKRLISLDAFRGFTIALMLLVNNAGDWDHVFKQLEHSQWNGCTAADMIFPFFVFIMGVAVPLGMTSLQAKGFSSYDIFKKAFKRTIILFGLGILLSLVAYWSYMDHFRLMGVLQRLAITYFFLASIVLFNKRFLEFFVFVALLLIYTASLIYYAKINGDSLLLFPIRLNLTDFVDTKILGSLLLDNGHDPEGLFATIPSISSGLLGVFCGRFFLKIKTPIKTLWTLLLTGIALIALGFFSQYMIAFNKNLWTPSYVLYSSGWAFLILSLFYYLIDIKNYTKIFHPFISYGSNAITIYFIGSVFAMITVGIKWIGSNGELIRLKYFIYKATYASFLSPYLGDFFPSALWGFSYVILFFFLADWMYRKKWFVKI